LSIKRKKERELDYLLYSKKIIIENYLELSDTHSNYEENQYLKKIINDYRGFGIAGESILGELKNDSFFAIFATRENNMLNKITLTKKEWGELLSGGETNIYIKNKELILKATKIENTDLILMVAIDKNEFYSYVDNHYGRWLIVAFLIATFGIYAILAITSNLFEKIKNEISQTLIVKRELELYKSSLEERVKKEVKNREIKDKLLIEQSKMATMGEMIGFITHQWKQPLTTISLLLNNMLEIINGKYESAEELKTMIKNTEAQIVYMGQTINDFTRFLRPSKSKTLFRLKSIIDDIYKLILPKMYKYNISLECNTQDIVIDGYENEFKQAILNIINNAIDSIDNYRVSNNLEKYQYEGIVKIDARKDGKTVIINIKDNGEGFKVENIEKIYEPYFSTKGEKGSGIGLYMTKLIIENYMQGEIIAYNNQSKGASFDIILGVEK